MCKNKKTKSSELSAEYEICRHCAWVDRRCSEIHPCVRPSFMSVVLGIQRMVHLNDRCRHFKER